MDKRDWPRFQTLWDAVFSAYNKEPQSPETKSLIFTALKDIPFDALSTALSRHLQTSRFVPTVADLRATISGSEDDHARIAWSRAMEALKRAGTYRSVDLGDEAAHYAIEQMGGWSQFGLWETDKSEWKFKEFKDHYLQAKRTGMKGSKVLPGFHAIRNRSLPPEQRALVDNPVWLAIEGKFGESPALLTDYHAPAGDPGTMDPERVKKLIGTIGKEAASDADADR